MPKPKVTLARYKEGEYQNLTGHNVVANFICYVCKARCTQVWDTVVGGGRYSFCSGNHVYKYLVDRNALRESNSGIQELLDEFPGAKVTIITQEQHSEEQKKQNYEVKMLMEYEAKYLNKTPLTKGN